MPLLEDDEETGTLEANSQDQTSGAQTFGFSSSRGAANPYTGQLQTITQQKVLEGRKVLVGPWRQLLKTASV